jgi:hypothetical protein
MNKPLQPLTKLLVAASAIVPVVFSVFQLFLPDLANGLFWPPPFEPISVVGLRYYAAAYLALGVGGFYALRQNSWDVARGYLAFAGPYVAISLVFSVLTALTPPGVPAIVWLYVFLATLYVALFVVVWRQQGSRAAAGAW